MGAAQDYADCVKAGVLSKCNLKIPLRAALDTTLHMAKKTVSPAVPLARPSVQINVAAEGGRQLNIP